MARKRHRFSKYDGPEELREKYIGRLAARSNYLRKSDRILHRVGLGLLEVLNKARAET